jgi:hypothetical protein
VQSTALAISLITPQPPFQTAGKCFENTFAILTGFANGGGFNLYPVFESTGGT